MSKHTFFLPLLLLLILAALGPLDAQTWPPELDRTESVNSRVTDFYRHGSLPDWGAQDPNQTDEFAVLHPTVPELINAEERPLYVILHSAGHALASTLKCQSEKGNHDIYDSPDDFYALILDCRANEKTDWWWGGRRADEEDSEKAGGSLSPCEKRVIDTVLWTIAHYRIDPNRVYLSGNSMGGSGTLGIGLRHGNIFAAIKANVPAGCRHAADRLYLPPDEVPEGTVLPDPPITVDYSGSNDHWSGDHAVLVNGMRLRKYPLMLFWGPFGHQNNHEKIEQINDLPNRFDWTGVRRDEAYPVFTYASTDSPNPWPDPVDECPVSAPAGQINGFFRWTVLRDAADGLAMSLRLASGEELRSKVFAVPTESTADVSFRRLQKFRVSPGEEVGWSFGGLRGRVRADKDGLITIPRLPITGEPKTVCLEKNPVWPGPTVDAAEFGFSPEAEPAVNSAALQKALDGGNRTVTISKPGVYPLDKTVMIDSNTRLACAEGVTLKKAAPYIHVILNRGAETGVTNENIEIENLSIATNGFESGWPQGAALFGLRGHAAFYHVRNLNLTGFKCLDVLRGQYALHICDFENIAVENFEIRGNKDGIHIGMGRGFHIAHGICQTYDDAIALNAEDYTSSQPIEGDIRDGLIEDITDERLDPTVAHAIRLLTGAWVDWHPGIRFQNGDTVVHQGNLYRVIATFDTAEYVSNNPPTHNQGAWKDPDEPHLTFVWNGKADHHAANIKNVTIKDFRSLSRTGMGIYWEMCDYHRAIHPEVAEENLPVCQITVENFVNESPRRDTMINGNAQFDARLYNIVSNGKIADLSSSGRRDQVNIILTDSAFQEDGRTDDRPDFKISGNVSARITLAGNRLLRPVKIQDDAGEAEITGRTEPAEEAAE